MSTPQIECIRIDGTSYALPNDNLETLQKAVGGFIELVYTRDGDEMYLNEEGKIHGLPLNIKATELYGNQNDVIVGDVVVIHRNLMN